MSRPKQEQIARALGVPTAQVHQLERRGMPTGNMSKAVAWFQDHVVITGERHIFISPRKGAK